MKKGMAVFVFLISLHIVRAQSIQRFSITDLEHYIDTTSSKALVVNFWATFCKPCVEEMPGLMEVHKKYKDSGINLLLVSLDFAASFPNRIAAFVNVKKISVPVVWLSETNADYFCPKIDSSWSGAIPATLFLNKKTGYKKFVEEEMSKDDFEKQFLLTLGSGTTNISR